MTEQAGIGLYVHVPFCRTRCHFCAFYLELHQPHRARSFVAHAVREIFLHGEEGPAQGRVAHTLYFGGGTPTALSLSELDTLSTAVRRSFFVRDDAEVSIEVHPATVSPSDLKALTAMGFTRVSFGAESMDDRDLLAVGRPGRVAHTIRAVEAARNAGFTNINLDLMYGLPGQTLIAWEHTLREAVSLSPTHVSCYALTVEEGTRLEHDIRTAHVPPPNDALQVDMERAAEAVLSQAGFVRYEISNYAAPGYWCRHNLLYWTGGEYLGLGPSAQSYVAGCRFGNCPDLHLYEDALDRNRLPIIDREELSDSERRRDAFVFGLRLSEGVALNSFPGSEDALHRLLNERFLELRDGRVRLTQLGRQYADTVAVELF